MIVHNECVYRGMDEADLVFPLDPRVSPFEPIKQLLHDFFAVLDKLIAAAIVFDVVETHFGVTYRHSLVDIVRWSKRDLETQGIDFTSDYQAAQEYADCWQGSQLKQNVKTISEHLLKNRRELDLASILSESELKSICEIEKWVNTSRKARPVILHARRSFDGFREKESSEFCCSLIKPISMADILLIEEV